MKVLVFDSNIVQNLANYYYQGEGRVRMQNKHWKGYVVLETNLVTDKAFRSKKRLFLFLAFLFHADGAGEKRGIAHITQRMMQKWLKSKNITVSDKGIIDFIGSNKDLIQRIADGEYRIVNYEKYSPISKKKNEIVVSDSLIGQTQITLLPLDSNLINSLKASSEKGGVETRDELTNKDNTNNIPRVSFKESNGNLLEEIYIYFQNGWNEVRLSNRFYNGYVTLHKELYKHSFVKGNRAIIFFALLYHAEGRGDIINRGEIKITHRELQQWFIQNHYVISKTSITEQIQSLIFGNDIYKPLLEKINESHYRILNYNKYNPLVNNKIPPEMPTIQRESLDVNDTNNLSSHDFPQSIIFHINSILYPSHLMKQEELNIKVLCRNYKYIDIIDAINTSHEAYLKYNNDNQIIEKSVEKFLKKIGGILNNRSKNLIEQKISWIANLCGKKFGYHFRSEKCYIQVPIRKYSKFLKNKGQNEEEIVQILHDEVYTEILHSSNNLEDFEECVNELCEIFD